MAKSIKEMAKDYGKVNYIVRYTADGEKEIDEDTGAESFEDGANAVLEEIEKAFPYRNYPHNGVFNEGATLLHLKEIIKALKDE